MESKNKEEPRKEKTSITIQAVYEDGTFDGKTNNGVTLIGARIPITDENGQKVLPSAIMEPVSVSQKGKSKEEILLERIDQLEKSLSSMNSQVSRMEAIEQAAEQTSVGKQIT